MRSGGQADRLPNGSVSMSCALELRSRVANSAGLRAARATEFESEVVCKSELVRGQKIKGGVAAGEGKSQMQPFTKLIYGTS